MKAKIAILGANYLQTPLIIKANEMGLETHVFAWEDGAVGKEFADYFYPISILEKDEILKVCKAVNIQGITTIGTDIAMTSVNYIAQQLGLVGNSIQSTLISTDKFEMRKALSKANIPTPRFSFYEQANFNNKESLDFPLIVKPTDRSGSRGVTKVFDVDEANLAIKKALSQSIKGRVIIEEFINSDREFSIEFISYKGTHYPITITDKVTTQAPYFVEVAHHQPAKISEEIKIKMFELTKDVLDALGIKNGASHTEVYLLENGEIRVVEGAGRMGGELIGSHMVPLSTGFDFMQATIDVALGDFEYAKYTANPQKPFTGVYYLLPKSGRVTSVVNNMYKYSDIVYGLSFVELGEDIPEIIDGADKRSGILVYSSDRRDPVKNPNDVIAIQTNS